LPGDDVERGEQSRCSVALVTVAEAVHCLAVGQTKIALSRLQRRKVGQTIAFVVCQRISII
jgi:hypothetical protein